MDKKIILLITLVIAASLIFGYAITKYIHRADIKTIETEPPRMVELQKQEVEPPKIDSDPIKEQLGQMTLDEKIGQMIVVGFEGYENGEDSRQIITQYHVGGFILFKRNIKDANQLLSLVNSLKTTNAVNKVPLFISVDEEGGRITRMPDEMVKIPTNKSIGEINDSDFSFKIGSVIAQELAMFGFNMDFAPVLDINSNPKNPVIGDRSFGTSADIVSKLGIQTMKGIQSQNIIPVVKHFPGHGDTSVDSHVGLPLVNNDLERLKKFELIPFAKAVENNADAVMIAHILLPKIDPNNPASFSKTIITDILRKHLNFNGVVITDDMTMGAIVKNYDIGEAVVKSVNAGSDIILVCHTMEKEVAVFNALKGALDAGTITKERIDESVYRILKLKQKYQLTDSTIDSVDINKINSRINDVLNTYLHHGKK